MNTNDTTILELFIERAAKERGLSYCGNGRMKRGKKKLSFCQTSNEKKYILREYEEYVKQAEREESTIIEAILIHYPDILTPHPDNYIQSTIFQT